jgi:ribonuclease HI
MEYSDEAGGREVQFWHVPRDRNREADALANMALDEA